MLGFDGLDYELTRDLIGAGQAAELRAAGAQRTLRAARHTIPPQSPVAWSTFITGLDPGGHGIFDFIHRDPEDDGAVPVDVEDRAPAAARSTLGDWQLPLSGGSVELLRQGQPFWEVLEERGIATTIIRMPANFPPSGTATRELSGMGTPDILGTLRHVLVLHVGAVRVRRPDAVRRHGLSRRRRDGVVRALARGPGQSVPRRRRRR